MVVFSASCKKLIGPDFLALLGNANGTYSTTGFTCFAIGQEPPHDTAKQTAYTARCASGPPTANFRGPGANSPSLPGTASSRALSRSAASALPAGAHLWYKARNGLRWLVKIAHRAPADTSLADSWIVRVLDDPGPIKINLLLSAYTTSRSAVQGSWCYQRHQTGGLASSVLRNADSSRGALTAPLSASPAPFSQLFSLDG